ncbi:MAG: hypothetical protein V1672_05445 [Candidatus Diapherotrites archaeon]
MSPPFEDPHRPKDKFKEIEEDRKKTQEEREKAWGQQKRTGAKKKFRLITEEFDNPDVRSSLSEDTLEGIIRTLNRFGSDMSNWGESPPVRVGEVQVKIREIREFIQTGKVGEGIRKKTEEKTTAPARARVTGHSWSNTIEKLRKEALNLMRRKGLQQALQLLEERKGRTIEGTLPGKDMAAFNALKKVIVPIIDPVIRNFKKQFKKARGRDLTPEEERDLTTEMNGLPAMNFYINEIWKEARRMK